MSAAEDIMQIPGAEGFHAWRVKGKDGAVPDPAARSARKADWIAIPAKALVSIPMRFHGMEAGRREAAVQLELEAAGFAAESQQSHQFETRVHDDETRDQRVWTCVQAAALPKEVLDGGLRASYAPSVCFQSLEPRKARLWKEAGSLALVLPDAEGRPLHFQALANREPDADAAAEVRCILAAAELAGVGADVDSLGLCLDDEEAVASLEDRRQFAAALDFPVVLEKPTAPHPPRESWRLVPEPIVKQRQARKRRRAIALAITSAVLVIVAGLGAYGAGLWKRQQELEAQSRRLRVLEPKLVEVRSAKERWDALQLALTPDQYPVELFYQLVQLLPPEGIRLTLFEMNEEKITLAGEASSVNHAISLREDLVSSPAFKEWGFREGFPQPSVRPDGRAEFHAEGLRPGFAAVTP